MTDSIQPEVEAVARAICANHVVYKGPNQETMLTDYVDEHWQDYADDAKAAIAAYLAAMKPQSPMVDDSGVRDDDRLLFKKLQDYVFKNFQGDARLDGEAIDLLARHRFASANPARAVALEEALRPFVGQRIHKNEDGDSGILVPAKVSDVRRAIRALAGKDGQ